ncbi:MULTISPECIES: hypothetical protein [Nocardia]|uniref:Uncharacterized protein n=1 Tax=Nocardia nova TaxID=37330 RepID=A0A2T2Z893_9NOCA|nr:MULTISPECIES: hypothetical protein [Nocardia]PSR63967.1 hypothetical protein C8259_08940 [Nocardia nova]
MRDWATYLRQAPVGTVVSDRDGDIWTKRNGSASEVSWIRTGGGWAGPADMVRYAPFKPQQITVTRPDPNNPTPALIEAAYIAQDDLSKPPEQWSIRAAAEVINAYIDAQGHTEVHVLGHLRASRS